MKGSGIASSFTHEQSSAFSHPSPLNPHPPPIHLSPSSVRGLGKTLQSISLIAHLAHEQRLKGPHLIVVPLSVMANWIAEFKKYCPSLKVRLWPAWKCV